MVKLVKIITPFSDVRILPNYIIACRTGVFLLLLLLFSRFKLARANAKQAWSARTLLGELYVITHGDLAVSSFRCLILSL